MKNSFLESNQQAILLIAHYRDEWNEKLEKLKKDYEQELEEYIIFTDGLFKSALEQILTAREQD